MLSEQTYPWGHQRRYNAYAEYFTKIFGGRVQKLTIDAGFTCPNRDGTKGIGGCTFCVNDAFNPSYCIPEKSITQQLEEGKEFHQKRYRRASQYLAYFQAYTNTYAGKDTLMRLYEEALACPDVVGLVIGTRPDCVTDDLLAYLGTLARNYHIVVEYGVESHLDTTLQRINRGHSYAQSVDAITRTTAAGLNTGAHIILGLPGETYDDWMQSAREMGKLPLHSLKLHQLQIIHGSRMAEEYLSRPDAFSFFTLDEYIDIVIDYLELLPPTMIIERFAGEVPPHFLAGPGFGRIRNDQILVRTEKRLLDRDTWQGRLWTG